jgi:hypothetical protein
MFFVFFATALKRTALLPGRSSACLVFICKKETSKKIKWPKFEF